MTHKDRRFEIVSGIRKSALKVLTGMLVASGIAAISVQPLKAQNQNALDFVLAQFAESGKIQAGANLPVQQGFADGGAAIYITPDVGVDPNSGEVATAQSIAKGFHANFIPSNWGANLTASGIGAVRQIFVFTDGSQGNVLSALPSPAGPNNTAGGYSPLWRVNLVTRNSATNTTLYTSSAAVTAAGPNGTGALTITQTSIIVECSVVLGIAPTGQLPGTTINLAAATFAKGSAVTSTANLPLQAGYYNHEPALYITPEVGGAGSATAQSIAQGFNANYVPTAFNNLSDQNPAVDDIYVFTNFTQGNVLASSPHPAGYQNTDPNYAPLWQINLVAWNSGFKPRPLTSQQDVLNAQKDNEVTVTLAPIIVECSVIYTPSGGLLPGAEITVNNGPAFR
ncbi:MAG: hypothetical protein WCD47_08720 [Candidatus Sulfotelmatobacter sp.]